MNVVVRIPGMHCEGCVNLIKDVSLETPGVEAVEIDLEAKTVSINHGEDFDFNEWKDQIESLDELYTVVQ